MLIRALYDNPWHRLRWTLPASLLVWALALWGLAYFMERPTHRPVAQPPVDAQFIELPEIHQPVVTSPPVVERKPTPPPIPLEKPAVSKAAPLIETPAPQTTAPAIPKTAPVQAVETPIASPVAPTPITPRATPTPMPMSSKTEPTQSIETPVSQSVAPTPIIPRPIPAPAIEAPPVVQTTPKPPIPALSSTTVLPSASETRSKPPAPSPGGQGGDATSTIVNSGARAVVRPMPRIPDDLRDEAFDSVALVRFHIAVDGNVTVELVRPTQNLRLNRILLDTLKNWQFSPAIKDGKPVASTEEIAIRVNVD